MKDVVVCDKPRSADKQAFIRGCPNGETRLITQLLCDPVSGYANAQGDSVIRHLYLNP